MQHQDFTFITADELKLYGQLWSPKEECNAVIGIIHGLGEHSGRFERMAQHITGEGIMLIAFDQRGHGQSQGKRGHTPTYDHLLKDISSFMDQVIIHAPVKPLFLLGHSMGGNLLANFLITYKPVIRGAILSAPYFQLSFQPPAWKLKAGEWMNTLWPSLALSTELNANHISRIPEEVKRYTSDRLVHDKITARMHHEISRYGLMALQQAKNIHLPMLIYHGSGDQITDWKATKKFAESVQGDVQLEIFEGGYHETHHDLEEARCLQLISQWIVNHC